MTLTTAGTAIILILAVSLGGDNPSWCISILLLAVPALRFSQIMSN